MHFQKAQYSKTDRRARTIWCMRADAKSGMSEVHELDTDIIYVLLDRDSDRLRHPAASPSIEGDVTQTNSAALLMQEANPRINPERRRSDRSKGTPHWFKRVDGPFLYYVVKVR